MVLVPVGRRAEAWAGRGRVERWDTVSRMCLDDPVAATEVTASPQDVRSSQIAALTGMRGFAALVVVVVHTSGYSNYPWLGIHGYGPIALFVLSGFLLYRPFARWVLGVAERPRILDFALRRVFRIFPAYLAVLFVWVLVYPPAAPNGGVGWLKAVTLVNTFDFFALIPGLKQAWSLGTELSWYVALPVLAAAMMFVVRMVPERWRLRVHVGLLMSSVPVSVVWTVYLRHGGPESGAMWLPAYLGCFGLGALVGLMMEAERAGLTDISRGRRLMQDPWLLPVLALGFLAIALSELAGPHTWDRVATLTDTLVRNGASTGLAISLLVMSVFAGPRSVVVKVLSSRFMQATGRWSYGIYLWHLPVIWLMFEEFTFADGPVELMACLLVVAVISYLLGAATYAWVEVPTIGWSRQLGARLPSGGTRGRVTAPSGDKAAR